MTSSARATSDMSANGCQSDVASTWLTAPLSQALLVGVGRRLCVRSTVEPSGFFAGGSDLLHDRVLGLASNDASDFLAVHLAHFVTRNDDEACRIGANVLVLADAESHRVRTCCFRALADERNSWQVGSQGLRGRLDVLVGVAKGRLVFRDALRGQIPLVIHHRVTYPAGRSPQRSLHQSRPSS